MYRFSGIRYPALPFVVLVEDISDDLLENVLHRDDAGKLTILIHHKFDVDLLGLHLLKKSVDIFRLRDEMRTSQRPLIFAIGVFRWSLNPYSGACRACEGCR